MKITEFEWIFTVSLPSLFFLAGEKEKEGKQCVLSDQTYLLSWLHFHNIHFYNITTYNNTTNNIIIPMASILSIIPYELIHHIITFIPLLCRKTVRIVCSLFHSAIDGEDFIEVCTYL